MKYIGAILIVITILGGLLIPLGPSIVEVSDIQSHNGHMTLQVKGSHTHFSNKTQFWVVQKVNKKFKPICPLKVDILNEKAANIELEHPSKFTNIPRNSFLHVVSNDSYDGILVLYDAIWVDSTQSSDSMKMDEQCVIKVEQDHPSFLCLPNRVILNQSIRNLLYHVPMWFSMLAILFFSFVSSILYLQGGDLKNDKQSAAAVNSGLVFGTMGIITGMLWATYTWGSPWPNDPKLNGAAIGMLVYFAYWVLRNSVQDEIKRAKLSAVYNVFAFIIYIVFIFIMPRITDSLHPGNGGNPGFKSYDLDNTLRMLFYPAVIGWVLIAFYIKDLFARKIELEEQLQ